MPERVCDRVVTLFDPGVRIPPAQFDPSRLKISGAKFSYMTDDASAVHNAKSARG